MKSGENSRARNQIKKIHWDKAITHENGSVIEVMIEYNFHGVPVKGEQSSGQVSEKEKLSFYRLILKKDETGGYTKYLMKYFPEQKTESQNKLEVTNYGRLSGQFVGEILLYDWDENLVMGWDMAEGRVIRFFRSREVRKGLNGENLAQQCQNYTELICIAYYIGSERVIECTESPVVECPADEGGAGWYVGPPGYSGGGGGSGGGGPTGPVPGGGSGSGGEGLPTLLPEDEESMLELEISPEFEQEYRNQMKPKEIEIFDDLSRLLQLRYLVNGKSALDLAASLYPESGLYNGCGHAFRHAYFSGLNESSLGPTLAKSLGDAHEDFLGNPENEKSMDLYNNNLGRNTANTILNSAFPISFQYELKTTLVARGQQSEFKIIMNGSSVFGGC